MNEWMNEWMVLSVKTELLREGLEVESKYSIDINYSLTLHPLSRCMQWVMESTTTTFQRRLPLSWDFQQKVKSSHLVVFLWWWRHKGGHFGHRRFFSFLFIDSMDGRQEKVGHAEANWWRYMVTVFGGRTSPNWYGGTCRFYVRSSKQIDVC